jgi:hypothetical protein
MFHIGNPFEGEAPVASVDIMDKMGFIRMGEISRILTVQQLVGQVEKSLEGIRKRFMLEYNRIFKKKQKKILLFGKTFLQFNQVLIASGARQ